MIGNLPDVAVLAFFLSCMVTYAASRNLLLLATCNAICVVCGLLLGRATAGIVDIHFSTGAPFIAAAMFGIALKHHLYGKREATLALRNILFALLLVFGAIFLLDRAKLLSPLFDPSIRRAGARFICLYLVQTLFVYLLDKPTKLHPLLRLPAIIISMEILEGLVFYPCVLLGAREPAVIVEFTALSISVRVMTTLLAVPCLGLFLYIEREGWTPKLRRGQGLATRD